LCFEPIILRIFNVLASNAPFVARTTKNLASDDGEKTKLSWVLLNSNAWLVEFYEVEVYYAKSPRKLKKVHILEFKGYSS